MHHIFAPEHICNNLIQIFSYFSYQNSGRIIEEFWENSGRFPILTTYFQLIAPSIYTRTYPQQPHFPCNHTFRCHMFDTMSQDIFLGGTLTVGQFRQCKLPKNKESHILRYDHVDICCIYLFYSSGSNNQFRKDKSWIFTIFLINKIVFDKKTIHKL